MQDMINGLLIVLVPMVLGYLLKVNNKSYIAKIKSYRDVFALHHPFLNGVFAWSVR